MKKFFRLKHAYLYLVLLTCTFCFSQAPNKKTIGTEITASDFINLNQKSVGVDTTFVRLMKEYKQECYNDSTEVETHDCPSEMAGCLVYHTNIVTIHRKPTFEEFIEWITKKYGL